MKWYEKIPFLGGSSSVHNGSSDQRQIADETSKQNSLDLSYTLVKELIAAQLDDVDALDVKANYALASATGLISAGLVLQSLLLPSHSHAACSTMIPGFLRFLLTLSPLLKRAIPLLPLLFFYLWVVVAACFSYTISDYSQVPKPRTLLEDYLEKPEFDTKDALFETMVVAYEMNQKKLDKKASLINQAFLLLLIEALLLVLLLLYEVVCYYILRPLKGGRLHD